MTKFDFERLKKHTEYTLKYELKDTVTEDIVEFTIMPEMKDRTAFLELVSKKDVSPDAVASWFCELALREEEDVSPENREVFKNFCLAHYGEIQTQTMIGFKLTTKEELDKKLTELTEKVYEKNLM